MNIIFVNPYFPPHAPGGAEYSLKLLCEHLSARGYTVHVLTNCYDGNPVVKEHGNYTVEYLESPVRLAHGQDIDASEYVFSDDYVKNTTKALVSRLKNMQGKNIIIANNAPSFIPVASAGCQAKVPTVGIVRDTQIICETGYCIDGQSAIEAIPCCGVLGSARCMLIFQRVRGNRNLRSIPGVFWNGLCAGRKRKKYNQRGVAKLDQIVSISDALNNLVRKASSISSGHVTTIGNFPTKVIPATFQEVKLYLNQYKLQPNRYFLIAGKKSYGKGSDLAVRAIQDLSRKRPDVKLLFVGKGFVSEEKNASFIDNSSVTQELLMGLLKRTVSLVIPGRWQEGLHRTMVDALKMGVPIITTIPGGPRESVINGKNGYVVASDKVAIGSAMGSVLNWDSARIERCKVVSAEIFQNKFSDDVLFKKWNRLFWDLTKSYNF